MPKTKKFVGFFTAHVVGTKQDDFRHLKLIVDLGQYRNNSLTFRWQSHKENTPGDWYAGKVEVSLENVAALRFVSPILRKIEQVSLRSPMDVVLALMSMGYYQGVYDAREQKVVDIMQVKGPEYRQWIASVNGECLATVNEVESGARAALIKEILETCGASALEKWIGEANTGRAYMYPATSAGMPERHLVDDLITKG